MSDENTFRADQLTAQYIALRDFKSKVKAEMDGKMSKIDAAMDAIEAKMMAFLSDTGQDSAKTGSGTFFKKTTTSAKVADRDIFLEFVFHEDAKNFLENRVNKTAVEEYISEHKKLPPGIDVTRVVSVEVHRPKTR